MTVHVIPDWYRALVPLSGGSPTPAWDIKSHLQFMQSNGANLCVQRLASLIDSTGIGHGIISLPTGSGIYPGNQASSVGLARLMNAVTSQDSD